MEDRALHSGGDKNAPPDFLRATFNRSSIINLRSSVFDPRSSGSVMVPTIRASHLRLNFSIRIRPCFSTSRAKTSSASWVDERVGLRDISLSFGQIKFAANAVD